MLSAPSEDYLKAIYYLQEKTGERVRTSTLADYKGVEQSSVTSMVKKLDDRELVHYEPYEGVELTETGSSIALEVVRHHRLLERYLTDHLKYDWSDVHDEADQLEHHISDQFADRIADQLDDPEVDPHGDPIPSTDLELTTVHAGDALDTHGEGDRIRVERVEDENPEILDYLSRHGIRPGTEGEIVEVAPFGMVTLRPDTSEEQVALPEDIASSVHASAVE